MVPHLHAIWGMRKAEEPQRSRSDARAILKASCAARMGDGHADLEDLGVRGPHRRSQAA